MRRSLVLLCALAIAASSAGMAHAAGSPVDLQAKADRKAAVAARRGLAEPTYDSKTLAAKLGMKPNPLAFKSWSFRGSSMKRLSGEEPRVHSEYQAQLSRLAELDPNHTLLSAADWANVEEHMSIPTYQVANKAEHIEFPLEDRSLRLRQTTRLVEKARGILAAVLTHALDGKKPSPEALAEATEGLAKKFSFFENPFRVELFIGDMRGLSPRLGRWDFAKQSSDAAYGKLPPRMQRVVKDLGQRVFAQANVMFADHMYTDALVTIDTLRALGLDTDRARFVTTPYPFDEGVRAEVEARGVKTATAPYSVEDTKVAMQEAIGELVEQSRLNGGPIVVLDDGGLASQVIAEHFKSEMHRFRIVEITKGGERLAKATLPKALGIDTSRIEGWKNLDDRELAQMKERFLTASSWDSASRADAAKQWARIESFVRTPSVHRVGGQNTLRPETFGFSHYTYSDSKYKREVMTPLYTQAVNRATFDTIEREGRKLPNKRVTIIGGGAMGYHAGVELREKGFDVTYVEPDAGRRALLEADHFTVSDLKPALKGRGLVMELSGMHNILSAEHLFLMDDDTYVVHGSSKDNPFDMKTIKALASEVIPWKATPTRQASASYVFEAAGRKRTLHFPGNGFTISHGGEKQNVPLKKYLPEVEKLVRLMAYALTTDDTVTSYPFYGTPDSISQPGAQRKALREATFRLE